MSLIRNKVYQYVCLLVLGLSVVIAGLILNPSFVSKHLSSDGILQVTTVVVVYILEALTICFGLIIFLYSLLKINDNKFALAIDVKIRNYFILNPDYPQKIILTLLITVFLILIIPSLVYYVSRIGYFFPIAFKEGWNVTHITRFLNGDPLYLPISSFPIIPVNYPPLSFLIIGGISSITGDILLTGRIISFISLIIVSFIIFGILTKLTSKKSAALVGSLLWLALMVQLAGSNIDYPQMLGHVFSLGAFYFYFKWKDSINFNKTFILALLCCVALFTKHSLVVVPITLGVTLLIENRRDFGVFALSGIFLSSLMLFGTWIYWGEYFFTNFIEFNRVTDYSKMTHSIKRLFLTNYLFVLFIPFIIILYKDFRKWISVLVFFIFSFLFGAYFSTGAGIAINVWFDFFIASALVFGLFAAESTKPSIFWVRFAFCIVLLSVLLPITKAFPRTLKEVYNYEALEKRERAFLRDVAVLKSISGPILFEEILLGHAAKKKFLFDPFNGTQLIVSGRLPESILTEPINKKYFSAIILNFNLEDAINSINFNMPDNSRYKTGLQEIWKGTSSWTDETLRTIYENYDLADKTGTDMHFFYFPKQSRK